MFVKSITLLLAASALAAVSAAPVSTPGSAAGTTQNNISFPLSDPTRAASFNDAIQRLFRADVSSNTTAVSTDEHHVIARRRVTSTSAANIVKYARFSGAAYKINSLNWNCGSICTNADTQGTNVVYHWNKGGVKPSFGYVALKSNTKEIIVAYRGSETAMDWVTDARVVQKAWPSAVKNSHVHSGFLDAYSSDAANIKKAVLGLVNSNPTFTIVITGHSLGGAEATLAAADFSLSYPDWKSKIALYTYGSPRAGNPEFASWVSSQPFPIFRVTYKGDPVPRIPLRSENFRHVTQEVYYPKSGGLKFCGDVAESNKCIDGVSRLFGLSTGDHTKYPGLNA